MQNKVTFHNYKEVLNFIESPKIGYIIGFKIIEAYASKPFFVEITRTNINKDKNEKQKLIEWFKEYGEIIDKYPESELPLFVDK